jgi:hypothetical protein
MDRDMRKAPAAWASWINMLLGIWLIVSPWVLNYSNTSTNATWNSVILGIAVLVLAWLGGTMSSAVPCWWNVVLGIWMVLSPYILRFDRMQTAAVNAYALGVVVAVLALVAGLAKMPPTTAHPAHG